MTPTALRVTDAAGNATLYRRESSLDSVNGQMHGYQSTDGTVALRFPASGRGQMQRAIRRRVGDVFRFENTRMIVRSLRREGAATI
ncbi:MAG: hypothetical protein AAFN70_15175, partial [Planctomycetota bacterium]